MDRIDYLPSVLQAAIRAPIQLVYTKYAKRYRARASLPASPQRRKEALEERGHRGRQRMSPFAPPRFPRFWRLGIVPQN